MDIYGRASATPSSFRLTDVQQPGMVTRRPVTTVESYVVLTAEEERDLIKQRREECKKT